jgi:hypothetical protein
VTHRSCHLFNGSQRAITPLERRIAVSRDLHPFSSHAERLQTCAIQIALVEYILADELLNEGLKVS